MTYEEYRAASRELGRLMHHPNPCAADLVAIDRLSLACEAYEKAHFAIDPPTAEEAAEFRREQERSGE